MRLISAVFAVLAISSTASASETISPRDFSELTLGGAIVGPLGPEVEASFVDADGTSVGDINSRVLCPEGVVSCAPPKMPVGTIYTYVHEITPGSDRPNDEKFAQPVEVLPMMGATEFRLGRKSEGFTGVAGYSFEEAKAATDTDEPFTISTDAEGRLVWQVADGATWQTGKTVTFFWQTTQPPVGPRGDFTLSNSEMSGSGSGPAPTPKE